MTRRVAGVFALSVVLKLVACCFVMLGCWHDCFVWECSFKVLWYSWFLLCWVVIWFFGFGCVWVVVRYTGYEFCVA